MRQQQTVDLFEEKVRSKSFHDVNVQTTRIGTQLMGMIMKARSRGDMNLVKVYRRRLTQVYNACERYHERMISIATGKTFDTKRQFPVKAYTKGR